MSEHNFPPGDDFSPNSVQSNHTPPLKSSPNYESTQPAFSYDFVQPLNVNMTARRPRKLSESSRISDHGSVDLSFSNGGHNEGVSMNSQPRASYQPQAPTKPRASLGAPKPYARPLKDKNKHKRTSSTGKGYSNKDLSGSNSNLSIGNDSDSELDSVHSYGSNVSMSSNNYKFSSASNQPYTMANATCCSPGTTVGINSANIQHPNLMAPHVPHSSMGPPRMTPASANNLRYGVSSNISSHLPTIMDDNNPHYDFKFSDYHPNNNFNHLETVSIDSNHSVNSINSITSRSSNKAGGPTRNRINKNKDRDNKNNNSFITSNSGNGFNTAPQRATYGCGIPNPPVISVTHGGNGPIISRTNTVNLPLDRNKQHFSNSTENLQSKNFNLRFFLVKKSVSKKTLHSYSSSTKTPIFLTHVKNSSCLSSLSRSIPLSFMPPKGVFSLPLPKLLTQTHPASICLATR